jgi:hypothetical protein
MPSPFTITPAVRRRLLRLNSGFETDEQAKFETGNSQLENEKAPWTKPTIGEILPGTPEFEQILAGLTPDELEIVKPKKPASNGGSYAGNGRTREDQFRNADGYPHGEADDGSGPRGGNAFYVYEDARGRPYLGVKRVQGRQVPLGRQQLAEGKTERRRHPLSAATAARRPTRRLGIDLRRREGCRDRRVAGLCRHDKP